MRVFAPLPEGMSNGWQYPSIMPGGSVEPEAYLGSVIIEHT